VGHKFTLGQSDCLLNFLISCAESLTYATNQRVDGHLIGANENQAILPTLGKPRPPQLPPASGDVRRRSVFTLLNQYVHKSLASQVLKENDAPSIPYLLLYQIVRVALDYRSEGY